MNKEKIINFSDFMIFLRALNKGQSKTLSQIHVENNITYSHVNEIKKVLLTLNMISSETEGVRKYLSLTSYGQEVALIINQLFDKLHINDLNINEYRRKKNVDNKYVKKETPIVDTKKETPIVNTKKEVEPKMEVKESYDYKQFTDDEEEELFLEDDEDDIEWEEE